jgi:hypothetical protein
MSMISAREALDLTNEAVDKEDHELDVQEALHTIDDCIRTAAKQRKYGVHTKILQNMSKTSLHTVLDNLRQRGFQAQSYSDEYLIVSWSPKL